MDVTIREFNKNMTNDERHNLANDLRFNHNAVLITEVDTTTLNSNDISREAVENAIKELNDRANQPNVVVFGEVSSDSLLESYVRFTTVDIKNAAFMIKKVWLEDADNGFKAFTELIPNTKLINIIDDRVPIKFGFRTFANTTDKILRLITLDVIVEGKYNA